MTGLAKPAAVHVDWAVLESVFLKLGTVHVGVGVGVGGGVDVGVPVGVPVGVDVGVGVGVGVGAPVPTGTPVIAPARIGKAEEAVTLVGVPRKVLMIGLQSPNPEVISGTGGEPD